MRTHSDYDTDPETPRSEGTVDTRSYTVRDFSNNVRDRGPIAELITDQLLYVYLYYDNCCFIILRNGKSRLFGVMQSPGCRAWGTNQLRHRQRGLHRRPSGKSTLLCRGWLRISFCIVHQQ